MKEWVVRWNGGGVLTATHPDDPYCNIEARCHEHLEKIGRYLEMRRGLDRAEFPREDYRIVRVT